MIDHKEGCEALGGYGHGKAACTCMLVNDDHNTALMALVTSWLARCDGDTYDEYSRGYDDAVRHLSKELEVALAAPSQATVSDCSVELLAQYMCRENFKYSGDSPDRLGLYLSVHVHTYRKKAREYLLAALHPTASQEPQS